MDQGTFHKIFYSAEADVWMWLILSDVPLPESSRFGLFEWFNVGIFHLHTMFWNSKQGAQMFDMTPKKK